MKLPSKYKYSGSDKKYLEEAGRFTKFHELSSEFVQEVRGYKVAERLHLPIPSLIAVDYLGKSVTLERLNYLRLDQLASRLPTSLKELLKPVEASALFLAKLHEKSQRFSKPDYQLQTERLIRLQRDLYGFGNIPKAFAAVAISYINCFLDSCITRATNSCYIHGDFICQNIFWNGNGLVVFDWENSCWSDPIYDLATFVSFFFIIAVKFDYYCFDDVLAIENTLLGSYQQSRSFSEFDLERYRFFKFFGHHCMYWYYLLLIALINKKEPNLKAERYLQRKLSEKELRELLCNLSELGFRLKPSSLELIYKFLQRSDLVLERIDFPKTSFFK